MDEILDQNVPERPSGMMPPFKKLFILLGITTPVNILLFMTTTNAQNPDNRLDNIVLFLFVLLPMIAFFLAFPFAFIRYHRLSYSARYLRMGLLIMSFVQLLMLVIMVIGLVFQMLNASTLFS